MRWKRLYFDISENGDVLLCGQPVGSHETHKAGYRKVVFFVHRLVAYAFLEKPIEDTLKLVVDHIDGNPANNNASNLQWLTFSENIRKSVYDGKAAKLTKQQVSEILLLKPKPSITLKEMAKAMGVTISAISAARCRKSYCVTKNHPRRRLTDEQLAEIRAWKKPKPSPSDVAKIYKVSRSTIQKIWSESWSTQHNGRSIP